MEVALHIVSYLSLLIFVSAVALRFHRIQKYPLHLRWELYPVPHEGKRSEHGGSRLEESDWWTKPHKPSRWRDLKFMLPEMLFIKALFEHNRKLWYRSFPFHFGLYLTAGFGFLLAVGAVLDVTGVASNAPAIALLTPVTTLVGLAGLALGMLGCVGLLALRLSDSDLKPYTNLSHVFNLLFILVSLGLTLAAWLLADRDFSLLRGYLASLITFRVSAPTGSGWVAASILALSLLLAYVPLTHMSHFFVKWFTWDKIRWDDEPNVRGGRIEVLIQNALGAPVSWAAEHIKADGKKNWVDIALEEVEK